MEKIFDLLILLLAVAFIMIYSFYRKIENLHERISELEYLLSEEKRNSQHWHSEYERETKIPKDETSVIRRLREENDALVDQIVQLVEKYETNK